MSKFKSKSFVYYGPHDIQLGELDIECGLTDIIIKVLASARCGTDKTIFYKGHLKVDRNAPIVLGHELVGEIVEVGKEVHTLKKGIGYKEGEELTKEYLDFHIGERVTVQSRIARYKDGLMLLNDPITI
ncbi:MAG: alcohol dehydrogenase catalytic domain-containing protein, partial [Planctomycetes bacterium]|nr:alcohol dehydrogenase catalytic domain-containing protein [Planctomycetota bacterium]